MAVTGQAAVVLENAQMHGSLVARAGRLADGGADSVS